MNTKLLIILAVEIVVIVLIACVIVYLCTKNDDDESEADEHKGPQSVQNVALNLEKMPKIPANQEPVSVKEQANTEDNWDYNVDEKADFDHNEEG